MTGAVLTLAVFGSVGWALRRVFGVEHVLPAGLGAAGCVLFVAAVLGAPLVPSLLLLLTVAVGSILLASKRKAEAVRFRYPPGPTVIAVVAIAWQAVLALTLPLGDYDGRAFWLLKAKAIAYEQAIDGPFFHDQTSMSPRNTYPLLVPIDAAVVMLAAGEMDDRHTRLLYVLFAAGFALALRHHLARLLSPEAGAWAAALFLWLPQIGPEPDGGVLTGSADIALGGFVACAFFELLEGRSAWRFGFWLPFVLLTKSEGLPLALLLFVSGIWVFRRDVLKSAVPLAVGLATLAMWRSGLARTDEGDQAGLIWTLADHLDLFGRVLGDFALQTLAFQDWGATWLAVVAAAAWLAWHRRWRWVVLSSGTIVPMVLLYAAVIATTNWDLYLMTDSVGPRLLTHLLGPAIALVSAAVFLSPEGVDRTEREEPTAASA